MPSLQQWLQLVATLWVGSLWTIGYVVAPTLFATLTERALAGSIAGALFKVEAWLSLACAGVMLLTILVSPEAIGRQRIALLRIVTAMAICTLIGVFGLQPMMASLRESATANAGLSTEARTAFEMLHGAAALIFFIQSALGVGLILKLKS